MLKKLCIVWSTIVEVDLYRHRWEQTSLVPAPVLVPGPLSPGSVMLRAHMSGPSMEGTYRPAGRPETDQTLGALNPPLSTPSYPSHPASRRFAM